jgi:hypothetical protein
MKRVLYRGLLSLVVWAASTAATFGAEELDWPQLGQIKPRAANDIASSSWSIGGETLDRDYADYAQYREFLGPLGAKAIRLQAGWAKCERTPGVYDWKWLDAIVDDAIAQGVRPWLEASYGNPLYRDGGGAGLGGGLPKSAEALAAWDQWVRALVQRYKDRVQEWEVWNEPDIGKTPPAENYTDLFIRTAEIIRAEQPEARIYGLALAGRPAGFGAAFVARLKAKNKLALLDAVTIHGYPYNPDDTASVDEMRAILSQQGSTATVRQGETGAPSTSGTFGALRNRPWSELTQAKWDLRRMLAHHAKDVPFNLFTLMELHYPKGWNTKGLLKAKEDMTVDYAKPVYYAAQRVFAIFDDSLERMGELDCTTTTKEPLAVTGYRRKGSESPVIAVWFNGAPPTETNTSTPLDLTFRGLKFTEPVYVDLLTGRVHAIPAARWSTDGGAVTFSQMPIYDSPILLGEKGAFVLDSNGGP